MQRVNVVTVPVMLMKTVKPVKLTAVFVVNVQMVKFLTVMAAMNAGQNLGLAMVLLIVKISSMVRT